MKTIELTNGLQVKHVFLGRFNTEEEARDAYVKAVESIEPD